DALRAQVELQTRQQQLIVASNNYAKQKLILARTVGLATGQEFNLTDRVPYEPLTAMGLEDALRRAYSSRADYQAARLQVESAERFRSVAKSSLDLASQTLDQARDRFTAGVADNLEVVQAQESVASANENYISSLYAHNVAKILLARSIGFAEQGVKQYLESK